MDAGLKTGDVIVRERGYAVTDGNRYTLIRDLAPDEPIALKIWRDGRYLDLKPIPAGYRFGFDFPDYKP